jgi:Xaa-Pro aminopeptidase
MEDFTADFFHANRARLRTLFTGQAPIVLTANGLLQHAGDSTYAFKQDSNFWYLTGINQPDIMLVMDKDKEYLIVPKREAVREAFDGAVDYSALLSTSGIPEAVDDTEGWKRLNSRLKKIKHLATIAPPPAYLDVFGFYANPARARLVRRLKEINDGMELLDLRQHLAVMRMVKQAPELAALQAAIDITVATLKEVRRKLPKYEHEYEVEAAITYGFRRRGSAGHAFTPIVAGGRNASTIHHTENNSPLADKELILLDVGAEVSNYAADITRTYSRGPVSRRQHKVHAAVLEVQEFAFAQLKPGVSIREYEKTIEHFMGEKLRELGLIKSIDRETVRHYYPHATSHSLGLDVHDLADYERPLEPNMVVTVEPGIYIPEEGLGVRMEDDVLITADGHRNMTEKLPREL